MFSWRFCNRNEISIPRKHITVFCILDRASLIVEEQETNLMSLFVKFYFTSSMLNMFRTLIQPSSWACDFSIVSPNWLCVLVSMCVGVSVWLGCASACNTNTIPTSYTETPTHIETRTHNECGDKIENYFKHIADHLDIRRYHPNPATPKLQHTSKQEYTTSVVIQ